MKVNILSAAIYEVGNTAIWGMIFNISAIAIDKLRFVEIMLYRDNPCLLDQGRDTVLTFVDNSLLLLV